LSTRADGGAYFGFVSCLLVKDRVACCQGLIDWGLLSGVKIADRGADCLARRKIKSEIDAREFP
jgi:hypothetical protein